MERGKNIQQYLQLDASDMSFTDVHHSVEKDSLSTELPTPTQANNIKWIIERWQREKIISPEQAALFDDKSKPLYDEQGRMRFQILFSTLYKRVQQTLAIFQACIAKNVARSPEHDFEGYPLDQAWNELEDASLKVWDEIQTWRTFLVSSFAAVVRKHLK